MLDVTENATFDNKLTSNAFKNGGALCDKKYLVCIKILDFH